MHIEIDLERLLKEKRKVKTLSVKNAVCSGLSSIITARTRYPALTLPSCQDMRLSGLYAQ